MGLVLYLLVQLDKYFESKVYTCVSEPVITEFIPTSTPKLKFYNDNGIQFVLFEKIASELKMIKELVCTFKDISVFEIYFETFKKNKNRIFVEHGNISMPLTQSLFVLLVRSCI